LISDGEAEELLNAAVNREFLEIVQVQPVLGRLFNEADFVPLRAQLATRDPKHWGSVLKPTVAILGFDLWQRRFGGSTNVIGRKIDLGAAGTIEIIGVFGRDAPFPVLRNAALWFPDIPEPDISHGGYLTVIGRLAPGASVASAQTEFEVITARPPLAGSTAGSSAGVDVTSLRAHLTRNARTQLWFLLCTAGCVLLIAGANVSNLLLTHASGRRRELHTRVALGASRAHLVRQALTEGLVLTAAGGVAAIVISFWVVPVLTAMAPPNIPRLREVRVGSESIAFAALMSVCLGLTCGLAASLTTFARHSAFATTLRVGGTTTWGLHLRRGLIAAEVAVALMLAIAAGLLVQTMRQVNALPLGFDPANVIAISYAPGRNANVADDRFNVERDLIERIRSLEGVVAAGVGSRPLDAGGMRTAFAPQGDPSKSFEITIDPVGAGYLEALGARLLEGRFFTDRDVPESPAVAIVNEAAVRQHWPGGALGQTIIQNRRNVLIVGVLSDVRRTGLEVEPEPTLYLPSGQTTQFSNNNMLVRTTADPRRLLPAIRAIVRNASPGMPITRVETLQERLDVVVAPRRFTLWLVGLFSIIAFGLAVIGIYGVINESVAQRVPEIGVRMALGATTWAVTGMVLREGAWLVGLGLALGAAVAFAFNGVMTTFVFRVPTTDPLSFAAAATALAAAGLIACVVPAWRASQVDPVIALRTE
jgi:putative ABC transport system permease protein